MDKHTRLINWRDEHFEDRNGNGIDDAIEPPQWTIDASARELRDRIDANAHSGPGLAAGDIDARWEDAESTGEEAVGGSVATPDQDIVDELGRAVGRTYAEAQTLNAKEFERRDRRRWELDPASKEED